METVGERIRTRREEIGMKQPDLIDALKANGFHVSQQNLSKIEYGWTEKGRPIKVPEAMVAAASKALRCSAGWLATGLGPKEMPREMSPKVRAMVDHVEKLTDQDVDLALNLVLQIPIHLE